MLKSDVKEKIQAIEDYLRSHEAWLPQSFQESMNKQIKGLYSYVHDDELKDGQMYRKDWEALGSKERASFLKDGGELVEK